MGVGAMPEVEELRARFAGAVVAPGDASYDEVRRVHNGLVDKHPALIVRCSGAVDVVAAVRLGRDAGLEISVRGGGHNVAGKAVTDGGLMIDLSLLRQIEVDPERRTITAGGGVTWEELNHAAHAHGLATTGGLVSTTGIAGLTLGGGIGWLLGKHGLAIDNLLSAEVVLASGEVVQASDESEPDLFWAIRGGGGNFGVVTEFCYRAYPLRTVLGGAAVHPLAATAEVFAFYREFTQSLSDDLSAFLALRSAPDGSETKLCGVAVCHAGEDEQQAEVEVKPVREFGPPAMDLIERMPYPVVNTLLDDAFERLFQLLEIRLLQRTERRGGHEAGRRLSERADPAVLPGHRTLPWRSGARRCVRNRLPHRQRGPRTASLSRSGATQPTPRPG